MNKLRTSVLSIYLSIYLFWGLALILLLWRIPYYGRFVLDDAFITFRYGFNLVHHGQFTFNLDEYVLATTTPVYALLVTGFEWLSLPVTWAAMIFNLGCEIALLYVLRLLIDELLPQRRALAYVIAGLLTLTNRAMSIASNSGMETPLFLLLNMLALLWLIQGRYTRAVVIGSLATLTRPDGIFVLIVLAVTVYVRERRLPLREVILSLLIALPWLVIATLTYGQPIPQSVMAKSSIVALWELANLGYKLNVVFYEPLRFFVILTVLPLLWGTRFLAQNDAHSGSIPLLLFLGLHLIYMALPNNLGFEWYFAPLYTTLNLITGIGIARLLDERHWLALAGKICAIGLLIGIVYTSIGNYLSVAEIDQIWHDGMFQVVEYLNTHADENVVIQSTNIGILGYQTGLHILDPLGLASPQVTPIMSDATSLADLLRRVAATFRPDYIVSFDPEDYNGYEQVAAFPTSALDLIIYQRLR